jgi:hypothetical protein
VDLVFNRKLSNSCFWDGLLKIYDIYSAYNFHFTIKMRSPVKILSEALMNPLS